VFKALNQYGRKVFLVGGKPGIVEAAALKIKERFPNVDICGCLDGYRRRDATLAAVVAAGPDFVLCGMGAPYQERFIAALRAAGFGGMAFTCGGFLDQLVKREQYYPSLIDKLNMRFAYRLYKEPRRLARRYFVEYCPFLLEVAGSLLAKGNDSGVSHEIESVPVICSLYDPVDYVRRGVQDVSQETVQVG
jgi:N-acetylglucosaminyldiphosphoundecaprenol N-acetyl-beta-D-mannosaminyltransferase